MTAIFDCTLRDSTYVVDFMLDLETTRSIAKGLSELGVSHIEVGHGLGLGGARLHGKPAGATDGDLTPLGMSSRLRGTAWACRAVPSGGLDGCYRSFLRVR